MKLQNTSSHGCPSFVKLVLEDDFPNTIRIPPAFMAANERELHNIWVLESPSTTLNKKFCPNLAKEKGGPPHHHLRGFGWRDLARSANLSTGDFLIFRCKKKSCDFGSERCSLFEVELYGGSGLAKRLRFPESTGTPPASGRPKEYVSEKPAERSPKRFKGEDARVNEENEEHLYSTDDTSEPVEEEEEVESPVTSAKSRRNYVVIKD